MGQETNGPIRVADRTAASIKLPMLQKPNWMEQVEVSLLGLPPPIVGPQVSGPKLTLLRFLRMVPASRRPLRKPPLVAESVGTSRWMMTMAPQTLGQTDRPFPSFCF